MRRDQPHDEGRRLLLVCRVPTTWRRTTTAQRGLILLVLLQLLARPLAFRTCRLSPRKHSQTRYRLTIRYYSSNGTNDRNGEDHGDSFDTELLDRRLQQMRAQFLDQEYQRPPNPAFTHVEFVTQVLKALWHNYDPLPDSGFRSLVRVSTKRWRDRIFESVAAPPTATEEAVASALAEAMSCPNNQFAILVGEAEEYVVAFPSEPIDYGDGTCWLECQLRGKKDNQLYAITGWSLERRKSDGAWLVDAIDWQDFRGESLPVISSANVVTCMVRDHTLTRDLSLCSFGRCFSTRPWS